MDTVVVVVPVYKSSLDELERYSLERSLSVLGQREVIFVGPLDLDFSYYQGKFPTSRIEKFQSQFFQSIQGYSRLLLDEDFYRTFSRYEFILLLQTDAIVLRDELDYWCNLPFDYVGAPWPDGYELLVNLGAFEGANGKRVKVTVGNGGLSLRRVAKCISLIQEFPSAIEVFATSGSSEDLFFSVFGSLSNDFLVPNEITASRFALELKPSYYFSVNGNKVPMGGHAWWKYEPAFWQQYLADAPLFN